MLPIIFITNNQDAQKVRIKENDISLRNQLYKVIMNITTPRGNAGTFNVEACHEIKAKHQQNRLIFIYQDLKFPEKINAIQIEYTTINDANSNRFPAIFLTKTSTISLLEQF